MHSCAQHGKKRIWEATQDRTVTDEQAEIGGFKPDAWKQGSAFDPNWNPNQKFDELRDSKRPDTKASGSTDDYTYTTGFHESAVATDMFDYLRLATPNGDGTHTLPKAKEKNYFLKHYDGQKVYSSTLKSILQLADGFRTDTAQTILSGPDGRAAAHAGSNINHAGQSEAHDLVRAKIMEILQIDPEMEKGLTKNSLCVLLGSITVTSIAPGEVARQLNTSTLKSRFPIVLF